MTLLEMPLTDLLTPRQLETLSYVAQGLSNFEISKRMSIGNKSVENNIHEIYASLNLNSEESIHPRVKAVLIYHEIYGRAAEYDFLKEAWVYNGRYTMCGHKKCRENVSLVKDIEDPVVIVRGEPKFFVCYGTLHAGECINKESLRRNLVH